MPTGALIGAGASIVGGMMGSKGAGDAADAQLEGTMAGVEEQKRQYDINRRDLAPGRNVGSAAIYTLADLLGLDVPSSKYNSAQSNYDAALTNYNNILASGSGNNSHIDSRGFDTSAPAFGWLGGRGTPSNQALINAKSQLDAAKLALNGADKTNPHSANFGSLMRDFTMADRDADPVYQSGLQFGLDTGTNAIDARARASGSYDTGAVLKELMRFGNDYGSTKANDAYNRYNTNRNTKYNYLSGVASGGQQAANNTVQAGSNSANNISQLLSQGGEARSAGIVGGANAWSGALGNVANQFGSGGWMSQPNPYIMNNSSYNGYSNTGYA